ncbi:MAG: DnaJ domain-containing protein [Acidobacteriota bacterium]
MAELARGTVADRPWGRTIAALALRGATGQLTLTCDGKPYQIAFQQGAIVGASSPLANDSAVRIALTGNLVIPSQVADISRRLAAAPGRDEVDVIAEATRIAPELVQRLRRRLVAQRAARTFSVEHGEFVVVDQITVPVVPGNELDVRTIVYMGARGNLTEVRLEQEVAQLGGWFQIKREAIEDLPQYGFTETERPVLTKLVGGASLPDLLATSTAEIDGRGVRAIVYALASCGACEVKADSGLAEPRTRTRPSTAPPPPRLGSSTMTPPGFRRPSGTGEPPVIERPRSNSSQPAKKPPTEPPFSRAITPPMVEPPDGIRVRTPSIPPTSRTQTPSSGPIPSRVPTNNSGAIPVPLSTGASGSMPRASSTTQAPIPMPGKTQPPGSTIPGAPGKTQPPGSTIPVQTRTKTTTMSPALAGRPRRTTAAAQETEQLIDELVPLLDRGADHFALLGVPYDAPSDAVRTAYFNLARKLHPDRLAALGVDDPQRNAQRLFAQINTAFAVLTDPVRRKEYMAVVQRGGEQVVQAEQSAAEDLAMRVMAAEEAFRQGEMALRRDQYAQAVAAFTSAVELAPNEPEYQALLAWAKFAAAADKAAIASATRSALAKAADASDTSITARFYLGRVERMLGREKEALSHFQMVLMLKPGHSEARSEARILEQRLRGKR